MQACTVPAECCTVPARTGRPYLLGVRCMQHAGLHAPCRTSRRTITRARYFGSFARTMQRCMLAACKVAGTMQTSNTARRDGSATKPRTMTHNITNPDAVVVQSHQHERVTRCIASPWRAGSRTSHTKRTPHTRYGGADVVTSAPIAGCTRARDLRDMWKTHATR